MSLQTNISGSNSRTFGHVCIDANRHFTSTESQSCVCFWCLFAFFCVGQVESSASWQAADPLLGQCLELIVTVRVTPIYTFSRPVLSQWGLHCCRESHNELLWLVLQIQVRGATDLDFLDLFRPSTPPCRSYVFLWWTSLIWLFKQKVTERSGFLDGDRWWEM